jgi:hypothetical protein
MFRIRELDVQLAESRNALSIERENDAEPYLTEFFLASSLCNQTGN